MEREWLVGWTMEKSFDANLHQTIPFFTQSGKETTNQDIKRWGNRGKTPERDGMDHGFSTKLTEE